MKLSVWRLKMEDMVSSKLERINRLSERTKVKFNQAKNSTRSFASELRNNLTKGVDSVDLSFGRLGRTLATGAFFFLTTQGASQVIKTTAEMQGLRNAITFASGDAQTAGRNFQFLDSTIDEMGLDLRVAYSGYQLLLGGMKGTNLESKDARQIFEGVSTAVSAMNLTGEQANGTYRALTQIMSKGKVQAEELRGQLGERIPGAFGIAAQAMGMTTKELDKLMARGEIMAEDFVPKFAARLRYEFAGALNEASNSLQANLNRWDTSLVRLKENLGEEFMPVIIDTLQVMVGMATWAGENADTLIFVAKVIGIAAAAYLSYRGTLVAIKVATIAFDRASKASAVTQLLLTTRIRTAKDAMAAFNLVTKANPLGLLVTILSTAAMAFMTFSDDVDAGNRSLGKFNDTLAKTKERLSDVAKELLQTKVSQSMIDPATGKFVQGGMGAEGGIAGKLTNEKLQQLTKNDMEVLMQSYKDQVQNLSRQMFHADDLAKPLLSDKIRDTQSALRTVRGYYESFFGDKADSKAAQDPKKAGKDKGLAKVGGGGRSIRNVTVNIDKLVERIDVKEMQAGGELKIKRMVQRMLLEAVHGGEIALVQGG